MITDFLQSNDISKLLFYEDIWAKAPFVSNPYHGTNSKVTSVDKNLRYREVISNPLEMNIPSAYLNWRSRNL